MRFTTLLALASWLLLPAGHAQAQAQAQQAGPATDYTAYLSAKCRDSFEGLRAALARGAAASTIADMRKDYRAECERNDIEARQRFARGGAETRAATPASAQEARVQAQDAASMRMQQCAESRRILTTKRARADLTAGEKAELDRFEANYKLRCT